MCASRWVTNPRGASNLTEQHRPTMIFCERFECEHTCWDEDGELYLSRAKRKLWWRLVAILTCKSFVGLGYRGED